MDAVNIIFGIIGVIGTGFSIYGAIISSNEAKKAKKYLDEINFKKMALELGIISTRVENLHKDIYNIMLTRKATRGANKEFDTYRKWYNEISIILNDIPTDMIETIKGLEEMKEIISSSIINETSMHDMILSNDSAFRKVESITYYINKDIKYRVKNLSYDS